jgi:hypothetical protein
VIKTITNNTKAVSTESVGLSEWNCLDSTLDMIAHGVIRMAGLIHESSGIRQLARSLHWGVSHDSRPISRTSHPVGIIVITSKFGKLSKLDFDTAEKLMIKALQELTAVGREEKEWNAALCTESKNDL